MRIFYFIFSFFLFTHAIASAHFNKVVVIFFENTNYAKAIKQPEFFQAAKNGLLLSNMYAETHPSQGNYIALIAGSTFNVKNDNNIDLDATHLGDLLEQKNLTWRVYAENYPGNCFTGASSGRYYRKHVPFLSFKNVSQNKERCKNIEDDSRFDEDLKNNNLANFNIYTPNILNDGHDAGIEGAGKWLAARFGKLFSNPNALQDTIFILTFDESSVSLKNQIYTAIIGKNIKAGTEDNSELNHYSILKLIEDEFDLGNLKQNDSTAKKINIQWQKL